MGDMQLPAITIGNTGEGGEVKIPKFGDAEETENDIEKVREEARQKENRYLEIISQYEEQLKKYKQELNIYQRRDDVSKNTNIEKQKVLADVKQNDPDLTPPPQPRASTTPTTSVAA